MTDIQYISVFSGIGGLEHSGAPPLLFCDRDVDCQTLLRRRFPDVRLESDIRELRKPPKADFLVGGWPCQDLSNAGTLRGLNGSRSGLFFEMLRVASDCKAHTFVAENVPNLLTINKGRDFQVALDSLLSAGFPFVSWRTLNARAFGLPQARRRLFLVASRDRDRALALHARTPPLDRDASVQSSVHGFYWTGGTRSICYSRGFVPALKIGSTDNKGRSPVAVLIDNHIRKLTPLEYLGLQGFKSLPIEDLPASTVLRMAGNAVPAPVGRFVMDSIASCAASAGTRTGFGIVSPSGMYDGRMLWTIEHEPVPLAVNLCDFLDLALRDSLSSQAAAGLIVRSIRSGHSMHVELLDALLELAGQRGRLKPSRGDSFAALDSLRGDLNAYRAAQARFTDHPAIDYVNGDRVGRQS